MPKVHVGTTALKNAEVQVYFQAHYTNRKILIDFSGLHSCQNLAESLIPRVIASALTQSFTPNPAAQTKTMPRKWLWKIRKARAGSKTGGISRASMWTLETCHMDCTSWVVKVVNVFLKSGVWICTSTCLKFQEGWAAAATPQQMLCFENIGQCCPASFGAKKVWSTHRKREDKDVLPGVTGVF